MKLVPVTKLDKRNTAISKKLDNDVILWQSVMSFLFFRFRANLKQSGSRIPDAWSVKLTFSLTVTLYLYLNRTSSHTALIQLS